jgi:glycosyltransferase involved in cell wall biosynthesis
MPDLLHHGRLVALAVVDEEIAPVIEQALRKPVVVIPDITDERREVNHPLEQRFLRFSGGSKLVLSIGHLRPAKGVINLAKVALDPAAREFAFAFVGEVPWSFYSPGEREFLEYAMAAAPTALFHTIRILDEVAYNSVVHACDVLFAAYRNFPHSSNTLTKAALFEKPLIVSAGHLMARRVQEYRMGEIVPQEDPEATLRAIRRLTDDYPAWLAENRPRWKEYRERHSYPTLVKAFSRLLAVLS